eukprot:403331086
MKNESNLNCLLMIFQGLCKLHHHLKRLYDAPNQKEKSPLRNSQPISSSPLDDDKLFENIDDVLTDCFLYEEQDSFLLKLIKDQNLQGAIERLTKSYLISGKDIKVIFQLFKMQGRIDAILIENNEMGQIDMLKKAKGFMQIQVSDNIATYYKPALICQTICSYFYQIANRVGLQMICGETNYKQDQQNTRLTISNIIIDCLIQGLLQIKAIDSSKQDGFKKSYALKLFFLLSQSTESAFQFKFKNRESNQCLSYFLNLDSSFSYNLGYNQTSIIYSNFFKKIVDQANKNSKHQQGFLDSAFMVSFQEIGLNNGNVTFMISQIIKIVLPAFFQQNNSNLLKSQNLAQLTPHTNSNDAFYFYKYISLQYKLNPDSHQSLQNLNQFLDLILLNIEQSLNSLIPNLFLVNTSINQVELSQDQIVKYISNDCQIMKNLFDRIVQEESLNTNESEQKLCLNVLLDMGLSQMKCQQTVFMNSIQKQQELILKSYEKFLAICVEESLSNYSKKDDKLKLVIDNNLNILAFLQCSCLITHKLDKYLKGSDIQKLLSIYLCQLLLNIYEETQDEKYLKKEKARVLYFTEKSNDFIQEKISEYKNEFQGNQTSFTKPIYDCNNQFLIQSSHQFVLNDPHLLSNLILNQISHLLGKLELDSQAITIIKILFTKLSQLYKENRTVRPPNYQDKLFQIYQSLKKLDFIQPLIFQKNNAPTNYDKQLNIAYINLPIFKNQDLYY